MSESNSGAGPQFTAGEYTEVDRSPQPHQAFLLRTLDNQNALSTYQPPKRDMLALLALEPGLTVLEAGCGAGDDARELARRVGASGRVVGVDLSDFMIDEARRRSAGSGLAVEFVQGDLLQLTYADNTFDCCRCERVLLHVPDPAQAIRELVRVTKPGGRVVVADSDWTATVCSDPITQAMWRYAGSTMRNPASGSALSGLFRECGLRGITIRPHLIGLVGVEHSAEVVQESPMMVAGAVAAGAISAAEAEAWPAIYLANGRDGVGFSFFPFFVVAGTKP